MPKRTTPAQPMILPKKWSATEDIDRAVVKLQRRISELETLDIQAAVLQDTGMDDVAVSNVRETIRDVFGQDSPGVPTNISISSYGLAECSSA